MVGIQRDAFNETDLKECRSQAAPDWLDLLSVTFWAAVFCQAQDVSLDPGCFWTQGEGDSTEGLCV